MAYTSGDGGRRRRLGPIEPRRVVRLTIEGIFVLAALTAIAAYFGVTVAHKAGTGGNGFGLPTATTSSPSASVAANTAGAVAVADCLPAGLEKSVPCDVSHAYEVVSLGDCTYDSFIRYLGGRPDVEIIRVQPRTVSAGSTGRVCVVQDPAGAATFTSVRNVLLRDGSAWRRCADDRIKDENVPCSQEHTSEYVWTSHSQSPVDCEKAAEIYLGAPPSNFQGRLRVVTQNYSTGPVCLVATEGADLLTASLRNIGVSALPIVSP